MKSAGYVFEPNRATCTALPKSRDDVEGHSQKKKVTLDEEWNEALHPGGIIISL